MSNEGESTEVLDLLREMREEIRIAMEMFVHTLREERIEKSSVGTRRFKREKEIR